MKIVLGGHNNPNDAPGWNRRLCRELNAFAERNPKGFAGGSARLSFGAEALNVIREGTLSPSSAQLAEIIEVFSIDPAYIFSSLPNGPELDERRLTEWQAIKEFVHKRNHGKHMPTDGLIGRMAECVLDDIADGGYSFAIGSAEAGDLLANSTMPNAWLATYFQNRLAEDDPVILWAIQNEGEIVWRDIECNAQGRRVMDLAAAHGLENGTVIVTTFLGRRCMVSLAHSQDELCKNEISDARDALLVLAMLNTRQRLGSLPAGIAEMVNRYAIGMTDEQIAAELDMSVREVKQRKARLIELTASRTFAEAMCKAAPGSAMP